ncbi:ferredoxin-type protein NapF [Shewanella sp. AS1]|uniref:ferredoxin-type protein NapF n=1 Tax=Shewanella sp. AS1 TaxID=2907626 RepID=UPI001F1D4454|nr:ferredoxin-type protein NapF [Shewanella sp. AS1]MCE9680085.1 ferredoxin-type protein NapF [Shewanella sp. AS1]
MSNSIDQSRRNLFRRNKRDTIRPPWSKSEVEFTDLCTRCDKCINSCETQILIRGGGGFPEVDFSNHECTFCQKCVQVCPEPVFRDITESPWQLKANIDNTCLTYSGVYCQSCKDSCDPQAITFPLAPGTIPRPEISLDLCTGCGACVAPCPNGSIKLKA